MKIKVLITGGTIDDLEYDSLDEAPKNHQSLIPGLLQLARLKVKYLVFYLLKTPFLYLDTVLVITRFVSHL